ncbi:MAG TPA: hypothetical protein VKT29_06940, partial [Terriglobales bacterium]|nr:hypothetical protein [Terriglobales bacterium]
GAPGNKIVLGKHSGRHALARRYTELGYLLSGAELDVVYQAFTALADRKKSIYDQDLVSLLPRSRREPKSASGAGARAAFAN